MSIERHGLKYCPVLPTPRIIRTTGAIKATSLVVLWLWWGMIIEMRSK